MNAIAALEKEIDNRHQALIDEKNASIEHIRSLEESLRTSQRRGKELEIINSCQAEEHGKETAYLKDNIKRLEDELQTASKFQAEFRVRVDRAEKKVHSDNKEAGDERNKRIILEQSITEKDEKIDELMQQIKAYTEELTTTQVALQSAQQELESIKQKFVNTRQALERTKQELDSKCQEIESTKKDYKTSGEFWSASVEEMKSHSVALEKELQGSRLALANALDESKIAQEAALEKSQEAERLLVSFVQGGSKLIDSLLNISSADLKMPVNGDENEISSLMQALDIPYKSIAYTSSVDTAPLSLFQPKTRSRSSKSKSRRRSESKSESTLEAKAEGKSKRRSNGDKFGAKLKNNSSIRFNISKIVCKDDIYHFSGPTVQFSFGEWKQSTSTRNRINDELIVAGKSIRWFEWDDVNYFMNISLRELTCQLMEVVVIDGSNIVGTTSINLCSVTESSSLRRFFSLASS